MQSDGGIRRKKIKEWEESNYEKYKNMSKM